MRFGRPTLNIRTRLFLLFLVLIVGPFSVYTALVVSQVSAQMETQGFHSADQVLAQAASFVESRADLVKRALDLMTLSPLVREVSAADPQKYDADPGLWIRDSTAIKAVLDSLGQNNPDIRGFVLYMEGGLGASEGGRESSQFLSLADQTQESWYTALAPDENRVQWFSPTEPFTFGTPGDLHALRRIPDDLNLSRTVGWARADVKVQTFEQILDKAEFSPASAAFLVDGLGKVVARSNRARKLGDPTLGAFVQGAQAGWPLVWAGNVGYRVNRTTLGSTGWTLALAIPDQDISAFGNRTRTLLVVVLAVMLTLMVPVSLWAASGATRRLDHLLAGVRRLGEGGFDVRLPEDGRDEIAELTRNFNRMVDQIRDLVDDRYRLGLEVKHLELQALQAQINPHFLYNTLDLINGLALLAGQKKIVETVSALSKFYRISLSGGAENIPLAQEFEHAISYVRIQNLRFDGAVDLVSDLDPSLARVPVLKMILQPLVENAILHGILEKAEPHGTIVLRAQKDGGTLVLEVEDDGVGMDAAGVEGLLARERPTNGSDGHGYGVFNIDRRLRLRYGDDAGLRFTSSPGAGTRVTIRIPC